MKKENMNNKGFSLVELIIVIAIMAILIVVLAPQYLKYVEKSRNSTDLQNAVELKTAIETYAADPDAAKAFGSSGSFTIDIQQGGGTLTDVASGAAADALNEAALDVTKIKCSSKNKWTNYQMKGEPQANGSIKWTFTPADFKTAMEGGS